MELLSALRRIRACEGEVAAQVVFEAFVQQEVANLRAQSAEKDRKLAEQQLYQKRHNVLYGGCVIDSSELEAAKAASYEQGRLAGVAEAEKKYSEMPAVAYDYDYGSGIMQLKYPYQLSAAGKTRAAPLIPQPPKPTEGE